MPFELTLGLKAYELIKYKSMTKEMYNMGLRFSVAAAGGI